MYLFVIYEEEYDCYVLKGVIFVQEMLCVVEIVNLFFEFLYWYFVM